MVCVAECVSLMSRQCGGRKFVVWVSSVCVYVWLGGAGGGLEQLVGVGRLVGSQEGCFLMY